MLLNERLVALRQKEKLTQSELGAKLNVSAQAISKWENGTSEPDIATLSRLAKIYDLSLAELLDPQNASARKSGTPDAQSDKYDICFNYPEVYTCSFEYASFILQRLGIDLTDRLFDGAPQDPVTGFCDKVNSHGTLVYNVERGLAIKIRDYLALSNIKVELVPSTEASRIKFVPADGKLPKLTVGDIAKYSDFIKKSRTRDGKPDEEKIKLHIHMTEKPDAVKTYFKKAKKTAFLATTPLIPVELFFILGLLYGFGLLSTPPSSETITVYSILTALGVIAGLSIYTIVFNQHFFGATQRLHDKKGFYIVLKIVFAIIYLPTKSIISIVEYFNTIGDRKLLAELNDYSLVCKKTALFYL